MPKKEIIFSYLITPTIYDDDYIGSKYKLSYIVIDKEDVKFKFNPLSTFDCLIINKYYLMDKVQIKSAKINKFILCIYNNYSIKIELSNPNSELNKKYSIMDNNIYNSGLNKKHALNMNTNYIMNDYNKVIEINNYILNTIINKKYSEYNNSILNLDYQNKFVQFINNIIILDSSSKSIDIFKMENVEASKKYRYLNKEKILIIGDLKNKNISINYNNIIGINIIKNIESLNKLIVGIDIPRLFISNELIYANKVNRIFSVQEILLYNKINRIIKIEYKDILGNKLPRPFRFNKLSSGIKLTRNGRIVKGNLYTKLNKVFKIKNLHSGEKINRKSRRTKLYKLGSKHIVGLNNIVTVNSETYKKSSLINEKIKIAIINKIIKLHDLFAGKNYSVKNYKKGTVKKSIEGWNKDKSNRPAGLMKEIELAEINGFTWDDLLADWKDGNDYLDVPNTDYNYENDRPLIYDSNGVPYSPLGPTNLEEVKIKRPANHPIKAGKDIGNIECWVKIKTYKQLVLLLYRILHQEQMRLAGMSRHEAMVFTIEKIKALFNGYIPDKKEYERVFRFIRWHAEKISLKDSIIILKRSYEKWFDDIVINSGTFNPDTVINIDGMSIETTGLIESTSNRGLIEFSKENYIDGNFGISLNIVSFNPLTSSKINIYIDDLVNPVYTYNYGDSPRVNINILAGVHNYKIEYECEVGDIAQFSGIEISGVKFIGASSYHKHNTGIDGLNAVNDLIQDLIAYYIKHHKEQTKGNKKVKERKIWLS